MKFYQSGRSMVEMLGVLAIIGVLSVGAISGYSTAMERYKLNKYISDYNYFLGNLLAYRDSLISQDEVNQTPLNDVIYKLNLTPDFEYTKNYFYDNMNGYFSVYTRSSIIAIDYHLEVQNPGDSQGYSFYTQICKNMIMNVLKPLHNSVLSVKLYRTGGDGFGDFVFNGDSKCTNGSYCLHNITLNQTEQFCSQCVEDKWCIMAISI